MAKCGWTAYVIHIMYCICISDQSDTLQCVIYRKCEWFNKLRKKIDLSHIDINDHFARDVVCTLYSV